ncbi:MAG: DUF411 domain-containing protein [Gemmatimonadota bacterium]|jgi:hypothetical protein
MLTRRRFLAVGAAAVVARDLAALAAPTPITVYKAPTCGCCKDWITYLAKNGFAPKVFDQSDEAMTQTKFAMAVPQPLWSCHTAMVGGYVVEGHVPAEDIRALLAKKPAVLGLAAPGMPQSSPGMYREGDPKVPYSVMAWAKGGATSVFARH